MMAACQDKSGRMKDPHYNIWKTNIEYLIENFHASLADLVSTFYQKSLITAPDKDSLLMKAMRANNREAARCFVYMLLNRGESILPEIIATLRKAKYNAVADKLETEMNAPPVDSSGSRGAMNQGHLEVWKGSREKLVENFKNRLDVLIDAFREVILGDDDMKMINNIHEDQKCYNPSFAATALVDALAKSGPDVLPKIITVLDAKGFTVLAEELQKGIDELNVMRPGELLWKRNENYLVDKMKDKTPEILDIFYNAGIITQDDKAAIEKAEQEEEPPIGTRKLVIMLAYRGEDAFSKIKEALQNAGYGDIIDNLDDVVDGLPEVPQDEPKAP